MNRNHSPAFTTATSSTSASTERAARTARSFEPAAGRTPRPHRRVRVVPGPAALRQVWAVAEPAPAKPHRPCRRMRRDAAPAPPPAPLPDVAVYRPYTEAMLRRYVRLSMGVARAPSLLGREMFRGHVSHYRVEAFDDALIFCHDVERAVAHCTPAHRLLLRRIAMQEYTQSETADLHGLALRTVVRGYANALDVLTRLMLESGLLRPLQTCQGG